MNLKKMILTSAVVLGSSLGWAQSQDYAIALNVPTKVFQLKDYYGNSWLLSSVLMSENLSPNSRGVIAHAAETQQNVDIYRVGAEGKSALDVRLADKGQAKILPREQNFSSLYAQVNPKDVEVKTGCVEIAGCFYEVTYLREKLESGTVYIRRDDRSNINLSRDTRLNWVLASATDKTLDIGRDQKGRLVLRLSEKK